MQMSAPPSSNTCSRATEPAVRAPAANGPESAAHGPASSPVGPAPGSPAAAPGSLALMPATLRMLCFFRECFPTHRVDVDVLFSQELTGRGHGIDFVMQACHEGEAVGPRDWRGRTVWVGPTDSRSGFWHRLHR